MSFFVLAILHFNLAYIALTALLYLLSILPGLSKIPMIGFYARFLASMGSLVVCATYGAIASAVLRVVGFGGLGQYTTARAFKWVMWWTTGVWFEIVEGEEYLKIRPAVFISNHQTELDVLMLGAILPPYCSVTAKKSLKYVPFLGWFMALSKTVFIDRANRKTALAAFANAAEQMHSHQQSVYIFPEGTRSYTSTPILFPFKKGAFHLAIQAQVPIVPAVVENYSHVLNVKAKNFKSGAIEVRVLKPIETKGMTNEDAPELTERVRDAMLEKLVSMSKQRANGPMAMGANGVKKEQ